MVQAEKIRNLAIIAHIDHGKTTLIDSIFKSAQVFRKGAHVEERVMDSNEIERERGITIRAKHCTVEWKDYLINIIDTPGHADFSGEVERILSTVDSVLLLVDANEGPMPQTRYVLMRALAMGLRPIVFINKIDRPNANPTVVLNQTFDLFIELGATEEQVDFPILYGSGLDGWAVRDLEKDPHEGMNALFETIIDYVPAPHVDPHSPFLMQVSTLAWNEYTGRIGCGKVLQGTLRKGEDFIRYSTKWKDVANKSGEWEVCGKEETRSVKMWITRGLDRQEVEEISAGDIVWISGPQEINIGDTFCSPEIEGKTLQPLAIEEPTVSMFFLINNGPFSGREGQPITLRQLKARLEREMHVNVALRVEDIGRPDGLKVSGRGELHLSILIEEMRREGMEFCVSKPEVITRNENDRLLEPMEELTIDVPEEYQGVVFEKLSRRKARLLSMENTRTGLIRLVFQIPTRGLIG
ncbi:MAG: GTP-binding protein, partial [Aminobacterium sp.]|nr:GTP-binding protein [Aminobacterium sp.]